MTIPLKFGIIIPTCNRPGLLHDLLLNLAACDGISQSLIVIVDSSDEKFRLESMLGLENLTLHYIWTPIRSAARQRNIGLDFLQYGAMRNFRYVCFLDDDVRVKKDYLNNVEGNFDSIRDAVGISGITFPSVTDPKFRLLRRVFLFDAPPGEISRGGVNVPFTDDQVLNPMIAQWLIGCSNWRFDLILESRFESDFTGASIFEDVIFSYKLKNRGKLYVVPNLHLTHYLAKLQRPNRKIQNVQWVVNRYRLFEYDRENFFISQFWWSNFGKLLFEVLSYLTTRKRDYLSGAQGIIMGCMQVLRK